MALPPEPIEALLSSMSVAFVGEVVSADQPVSESGPVPDPAYPRTGGIGSAAARGSQRVSVRVDRALHGDCRSGAVMAASKPPSAYVLVAGLSGVFLLDRGGNILGRYGPRTFSEEEVARAIASLGAPSSSEPE